MASLAGEGLRLIQGDAQSASAGATGTGRSCRFFFGPGLGPKGISLTNPETNSRSPNHSGSEPFPEKRCPMSPVQNVTSRPVRTSATAKRFLKALLRALSTWSA